MQIHVYDTKEICAKFAAERGAEILRKATSSKQSVRAVFASAASQIEFLQHLTSAPGIDWKRVELFHLDEYIGISEDHPASFRRFLKERVIGVVPIGKVNFINGSAPDAEAECKRISALLDAAPIDVGFIGIGENGHLAFNDPPADFEAKQSYKVVELDQVCRNQQLGEGWFPTLDAVPKHAISMTIPAIMRFENIICTAPDARKAQAVKDCLSDSASVSNMHPASIMKQHAKAYVYLDKPAAALLNK
ncbi:glucosamine-6-phosphate deaminase [bacterium]|nr:glucosamine-6-phosphate deaminase [bacterium]